MQDTLESTKSEKTDSKKKNAKKDKPEVVGTADYMELFEFRKNMSSEIQASFDLKDDQKFGDIIDHAMEVVNAGLRKAIIWTSYKNRRGSQLVHDIFVESKDVALPKGDELMPDAWQFGVTGRPEGGMKDFMVVPADDRNCKYVCAVRKPRSVLGFYNFKVHAGIFPTSSKLDLKSEKNCPRRCLVNYGYSRLEQVVVYFLPIELV